MQIPTIEALSLLRKWQQERVLLQCAMRDLPQKHARMVSAMLGRVERVDERELYIDSSSLMERYGKYFSCHVTLTDAIYHFGDWRDAANQESGQVLKTGHDYFLAVFLPTGGLCEILAAKPGGEVLEIVKG